MNAIKPLTEFAMETTALIEMPRFGSMWIKDAIRDIPSQRWLVRGLLPEDSLIIFYGPHGTAKTFIAIDAAMHICEGRNWREHRVEKRGVVYVGAEGRAGLRKRFKAYTDSKDNRDHDWNLPLVLMQERINLLDDGEVNAFIETCKRTDGRMQKEMGVPLGLITFDTLARCMPRANENSSEHMSWLVDNVDRVRRALGGVSAMFVHHTGKDASKGARGFSSLPAAADTMIEMSKDESRLLTASLVKQKDESDGIKMRFRIRRVVVGTNDYGEEETSCVVVEADDEAPRGNKQVLKGAAKIAYQCLTQALLDHGKPPTTNSVPPMVEQVVDWRVWRDQCDRGGLVMTDDEEKKQRAFEAAGKVLRERGWIGVSNPWVWPVR